MTDLVWQGAVPTVIDESAIVADPDGFVKAKRSYGHGECVEIAADPDGEAWYLRDSKNPDRVFRFEKRATLAAFIAGLSNGEFASLLVDPERDRMLTEKAAEGIVHP